MNFSWPGHVISLLDSALRNRRFFLAMRIFLSLLVVVVLFLFLTFDLNPKPDLAFAAGPSTTPAPTVDRLAEPTLPPDPDQADLGAQDYWLNCMPCHGDRGQGLTDEFRMLYPEEDRNCWSSGCHGSRPYQNGFTLPMSVPPIIGPQSLNHFSTAERLNTFIRSAMPYQDPGSLDELVYWRLTAFLLRENNRLNPNESLGPDNASQTEIQPTGTPNTELSTTPSPETTAPIQTQPSTSPYLTPLISLGFLTIVILLLLLRVKTTPPQ